MRLALALIGSLALSCATASEHPTAFDAMQALAANEPIDPERRRSAIVGGVLGAGVGLAAGVAVAVAATAVSASDDDVYGRDDAYGVIAGWMTLLPAGTLVGAVVGALIGWGDDP